MTKTNFDLVYDQDYKPYQNYTQAKIKRKKSKKMGSHKMNSKKWTILENERYLQFVKKHGELLSCPNRRKGEKVFLQMSHSVKTRTSDQCRSHNQKMIKHHMNLEGVIKNLEERLQIFEEKLKQMEKPVEVGKLQNIQQKKLEDIEAQVFMENQNPSIKLEQKQEQNLWNLLDKDVWISESLFCCSPLQQDQQI